MPWLPPKGLERLKTMAINRGLWEDLGNGYVTKRPQKKRTSVQILAETAPDDQGRVRLRVNASNGGPSPRIHFSETGKVTERNPQLQDEFLMTSALRVAFLVVDPSGQYETGDPTVWEARLVIRNELHEEGPQRRVALMVAPRGTIRFSLDGREPRNGKEYVEPIEIPDSEVKLLVFAEADGLETKAEFAFPPKGRQGVKIDPGKPARLVNGKGGKRLDSRAKAFKGLQVAREQHVLFENVTLTVGQGSRAVSVTIGEIKVDGDYLEAVLKAVLDGFEPDAPITLSFRKAHYNSGHDLQAFAESLGLEILPGEVEQ